MAVDHLADAARILGRNSSYAQRSALAQKRRSLGTALAKRPGLDRPGPQLATALKTRAGGTGNVGIIPSGFGVTPFGQLPFGQ